MWSCDVMWIFIAVLSGNFLGHLMLLFTSDGVVVGTAEWYAVEKSESEHRFLIRFKKKSGRTKPITVLKSGPCDWLVLPFLFRLRQSSFHWIISDGVVNGIGKNGNVLIILTPIPSSLCQYDPAYDSDFRFSLDLECSYDSDSDSPLVRVTL